MCGQESKTSEVYAQLHYVYHIIASPAQIYSPCTTEMDQIHSIM